MTDQKQVNLVLSGSGMLYLVHAGAVCALTELGYSFKAISATSGGSLVGAPLSLGFDPQKIKRRLIDHNIRQRLFREFQVPGKEVWGFFKSPIEKSMSKILEDKTFLDTKIPLYLVGTEVLPNFKLFSMSKQTTPLMRLAEACKITCTIPILFRPIRVKDRLIIDGTFVDDLHIEPFSDDLENTIAINIISTTPDSPKSFWGFFKLAISMVVTKTGAWVYKPKDLKVITIEVAKYTATDYNIGRMDRKELFKLGYDQVMKQLGENVEQPNNNS